MRGAFHASWSSVAPEISMGDFRRTSATSPSLNRLTSAAVRSNIGSCVRARDTALSRDPGLIANRGSVTRRSWCARRRFFDAVVWWRKRRRCPMISQRLCGVGGRVDTIRNAIGQRDENREPKARRVLARPSEPACEVRRRTGRRHPVHRPFACPSRQRALAAHERTRSEPSYRSRILDAAVAEYDSGA